MIIDLKRTLFPYAHALLMIDGGGSLVPDFQPGPPYLHAPVQLLVVKEINSGIIPNFLISVVRIIMAAPWANAV